MALYHLHVKNITRTRDGGGKRSAVAVAAYRAGTSLQNDYEDRVSDFRQKQNISHSEIITPLSAPDWMQDREKLWNAVDAQEKRKDSRLAKEVEFSLLKEIPLKEGIILARQMAGFCVEQLGAIVDMAVHDDPGNPHVHLLLTTRLISKEGFGLKNPKFNRKDFILSVRKKWEEIANEALAKVGALERIDRRSHAERGIKQEPGRHRGPDKRERLFKRQKRREQMRDKPVVQIDEQSYYRDDRKKEFRSVDNPKDRIGFDDPRVRDLLSERISVAEDRPSKKEGVFTHLKRLDAEREIAREAEEGPLDIRSEKQERQALDDIAEQLRQRPDKEGVSLEREQGSGEDKKGMTRLTLRERYERVVEVTDRFVNVKKYIERDAQSIKEFRQSRERTEETERYDPSRQEWTEEQWQDYQASRECMAELDRDLRSEKLSDGYPEGREPVPGPEGRLIPREDLEAAQDRMRHEYERDYTREDISFQPDRDERAVPEENHADRSESAQRDHLDEDEAARRVREERDQEKDRDDRQ